MVAMFTISTAIAQDLEPRAYSASPVGLNFVLVGVGRSTGGVVVDPAGPLQDVDAKTNVISIGAGRTFALIGRTALIVAALPYALAEVSGRVGETSGSVSRSGLADPRIRFSVNLVGGRAMELQEFARSKRSTIVGVSLAVAPPFGQYDRNKLVNLGANRWSFKPEAGISHSIGEKWTIDGYAGVLLFTENDEYYPGSSVRTQDPIFAFQGHASYTLKPRFWLAFDATWYTGGITVVDGTDKGNLQRNSRVGATMSLPLTRAHSLKFAVSKGATTRVGSDFTTISAAWQVAWFN
jgi:outer membrane putative beta-barrel porin/alpha-amylase